MTKYRQAFMEMITKHEQQFSEFKRIHDLYQQDSKKFEDEFNSIGKPLVNIIHEYENRLCAKMEGSGKAAFTSNVSDKFWEQVRAFFPLIDLVGAKIK